MDERHLERAGVAAEKMAEINRESYRAVVERAFAMRESNERLTREFFEEGLELLQDHNEMNRGMLETLAAQAREQREVLWRVRRESFEAHDGFVGSLSGYYEEVVKGIEDPGE